MCLQPAPLHASRRTFRCRSLRQAEQAILQIEDTLALPGPIWAGSLNHFGQSPRGEGTGLGPSIVKRIVDSLRGSVALEDIGRVVRPGLRVLVRLPMSTEATREKPRNV